MRRGPGSSGGFSVSATICRGFAKAIMRSILGTRQRQEREPSSGPVGPEPQQYSNMPSFNRRRATLGSGWVRNPTVVDGPVQVTNSHIDLGIKQKKYTPILLSKSDYSKLPTCQSASCTAKARYALTGKDVVKCSLHRAAEHHCVYTSKITKVLCHCGTAAIYRDKCQVPLCYWHKSSTSTTKFSWERVSMHYKGKFVGCFVQEKGPEANE